jgi:hypothetical protein
MTVRARSLQELRRRRWVDASGETFETTSPANGETLGVFPKSGGRTSIAPSRRQAR